MPFVGGLPARRSDTLRYLRPEFSDPCPDGFIAYSDTVLGNEFLNVPQAERKSMICANRVGNDGPREAVAFLARLRGLADHRHLLQSVRWLHNYLTIPDQDIGSVTADGAYDTRNCHDAIAERHAVTPSRKNAKPWKSKTQGAITRNEAVNASRHLGRAI